MMSGGRPRCLARENQFFKVLVDDFANRLSIPKAYIEEMPEELSGTVILHGPSGNCWPVGLSKTAKGTYLAGGWEAFAKDHSLTEGEFLVFTYVRFMHFKVKIFGRNACEREDAFTVQPSLKLPRVDEAKFTGNDTFTFKASHGLGCLKERNKYQSPRRDAEKIALTSKPKALGGKANEAAYHFTSQFPYFLAEIKSYCLGVHQYLVVPAAFVKKLPPKTKNMMLQNANGKDWPVKYCYSSRPRISCGWTSFAYDNHIKVGDLCVFELVQKNIMKVHICSG